MNGRLLSCRLFTLSAKNRAQRIYSDRLIQNKVDKTKYGHNQKFKKRNFFRESSCCKNFASRSIYQSMVYDFYLPQVVVVVEFFFIKLTC